MTRSRPTLAWLLCLALAWTAAGSLGVSAQAVDQPPPAAPQQAAAGSPEAKVLRTNLDASRAEIEQAEATFRRVGLSSDELQELRSRLDPVVERLRSEIAALAPKLEAVKARLDQLGPKPKEDASPEGADVARDRTEREAAFAELDEVNRLAKALLLQAEQLTSQISDRRRAAFASALFQRSYSIVSPDLWVSTARSFTRDLRAMQLLAEDAARRFAGRSSPLVLTLLGLAIGIGAALHIGRRHIAPRLVHRDAATAGVSPARKLLAALGVLTIETLPAVFGSLLIYQSAALLDLLPGRLMTVAAAFLGGLAFVAFVQGLADAILAPNRPTWRLVDMPDKHASSVMSLAVTFASVIVVGKTFEALNQSIAAGLPLSIAVRGMAASFAALTLAVLLHQLAETEEPDDSCLGPYIAQGPAIAGPLRMVGWLLVAFIVVGVLGGYIALSSFLVDQVAWVATLAGLLYLAIAACDRLLGGTLKENSRVSTTLQANLGLRSRSLQQLGVIASGIGRVVLIVIGAMLALAPWGIESADFTTSLRTAFFGFKVGDVTISPSTTIVALLSFGAAVAATRVFQRWLTNTLLPTTELDAGLRNSITTAAGYLGVLAAVALAFAYLGLSLEKIAIVAGALSVGIGFGLQSIVNNFVSGLILLWERPIRVGDLVVVGDGEGYVRRISVRATEIETFDRSTIIVPNSNLISGIVKNRVRTDQTGRVILPVNVLRNQDPVRAAALLVEHAMAHPDVLKEPPPRVVFKKIGETWLEFDLVCFVDDVSRQLRVQSDLNFSVFAALVAEGILPPLGPGAMTVGGLEPVQTALRQIADAIASGERAPAGPATVQPPVAVEPEAGEPTHERKPRRRA